MNCAPGIQPIFSSPDFFNHPVWVEVYFIMMIPNFLIIISQKNWKAYSKIFEIFGVECQQALFANLFSLSLTCGGTNHTKARWYDVTIPEENLKLG